VDPGFVGATDVRLLLWLRREEFVGYAQKQQ
jgi:hypothetical protein